MVTTFLMLGDAEFRDHGRLVAKYRKGQIYRLTDRNRAFVADLVKAGKATPGTGPAGPRQALRGKVTGRVSVKG